MLESARRLAADLSGSGSAPLNAIAAAQDLARATEAAIRIAVDRAREAGSTWQEIGEVLGTTRQGAFQRFGRPADPRTGAPMTRLTVPDAPDRAVALLADLTEGRWDGMRRDFNAAMAAEVGTSRVAAVWARAVAVIGRYEHMGEPFAYQVGDHTVVDVLLSFEAGEIIGRVSYDRDGQVAGLLVMPPHQA